MRPQQRQNIVEISALSAIRACRHLQGSDNGGKRLSVVCEERFVLLAAKLVFEMGGNMSFLIHGAPQSNVRVLIGNAHSRRKSIMTVLSCNARGGLKTLSFRAGMRCYATG